MKMLQEEGIILSSTHNPQSKIQNSKSTIEMREQTTDSAVAYAVALLSHYGFELRGYTAKELVNLWLRNYSAHWVRLGVIEALYQGRYKAVSVEQILAVWARRGQPIYRFNHEFERLISRKLPQSLTASVNAASTELNPEYSLPPLTPSSPNITDKTTIVEATPDDPPPTPIKDTPPTATMPREELPEISVESDDTIPEALSHFGASPTYAADWSRCDIKKQPIHQFTPPPDASGFYLKLKAVVQQQEETSTQAVKPLIDEVEGEQT